MLPQAINMEKNTEVHYQTKNLWLSFKKTIFICSMQPACVSPLLISCKHDQDQFSVYAE